MKFSKALPWLPSLLVLAGCPGEPEPKPPQLDKVSVTCAPTTLEAGQSAQCSASASDQNGQPFTVSSYTWSSGDDTLAHVDTSGKVATVVVSSGTVAIRASASSGDTTRQGEAALSVTPKPPTLHSTSISSSETWRVADNPHLVSSPLTVDGAATLTLEAGLVVRFAPGAELRVVRGTLLAPGTAQAPILLQAQNGATRGSWSGLVLSSPDSASTLAHVTMTGCGGAQSAGACLVIRDGAAPVLQDVSVRDSASAGVLVAGEDSSFGTGSARLSVSGSTGPAVRLEANQAGTFPTGGSFTGNVPNGVELTGSAVSRTQTWPNPGVPFIVNEDLSVGNNATPATLTLAAGTVVRFGANARLVVSSTGDNLGGLVLDGTADAPILLTAHSDNPQPGHWRGVHVVTTAPFVGRISHATIEFAGKADPDELVWPGNGNINLYSGLTQGGPFTITDILVQKSSGPGVYQDGGEFGTGSARLTSRDNATYPIFMQPSSVRTLPRDIQFQNNGINMLALSGGGISETQTWTNLGLPYLLTGGVIVGYTTNPTLTLAPGTEFRVAQGALLLVGHYTNRPGALVAAGTADAPIRFIPDSASAPNGYWSGIHFWNAMGSRLDHVLVTHGGAGNPDYAGIIGSGNLNVHKDLGNFVTNSTFKNGQDCAVTVDSGIRTKFSDPSFNNVFTDNPNDSQCFN
jgi:hypothetical protein